MRLPEKSLFLLATMILISINVAVSQTDSMVRKMPFDTDWKFHRGGAQGAERPDYDDSGWRSLELPHDWSIEDLHGTTSPFDINAISQVHGGFTTGGTGWYRKSFRIPPEMKGKRFIIMFDGIYMNSEVWLNGRSVGKHPYGYTSFWFDVTDRMMADTDNLLAIKVRNEGENSRWYSGSGIYRHVWLMVLSPVHIIPWGIYITTPEVSERSALINIRSTIANNDSVEHVIRITSRILDKDNSEITHIETEEIVAAGASEEFIQDVVLNNPALWSVDRPILYTVRSEIKANGELSDVVETDFGIRSISFSTGSGFMLNGKSLELKGGCIHHDNGPLGAKAFDRAEERRVEILKASGFNAVRCAHNPPSPAFLDACDRLGMLIIDESFDTWYEPKNTEDYNLYFTGWWKKDTESMIFRDRNHPSVIMWSIGNEIPNRHTPEVAAVAKMMGNYVRSLDPTRPVTSAVNDIKPDKDSYFATLDIAGYNYPPFGNENTKSLYEQDHLRLPERIIYCSESFPLESFKSWMGAVDNSYILGDFVWTAWDYIGEASIGWRGYPQSQDFFPWNIAYCGDIDICGWKRPQSYYRDALWMENQLSLWVTPPTPSFEVNNERQPWSKWHWHDVTDSWNWEVKQGTLMEVTAYSSCDYAELFLDDKSLGRKKTDRSSEFKAVWQVPYMPGTLTVRGYRGDIEVNSYELKSAGEQREIRLSADRNKIRADGQDLAYITVELTDVSGIRNPLSENLLDFEVTGPGSIIAVGNANPVSLESCTGTSRRAWKGRCLVILKSGKESGTITVRASSPGLQSADIKITTE